MTKINDSGKRQSFVSGAVRDSDSGKPRIDLISPFAMERLGHWMRKGAEKYEERNWEKGMPVSRCIASLYRHLVAYHKGCNEEDHLAAVMFNAMAIIHYEEMISRGNMDPRFDDMPDYDKPRIDPAPVEANRYDLYNMLDAIEEETNRVIRERDAGDETDRC